MANLYDATQQGWNLNPVGPDGTPTTSQLGRWISYAPTAAPYARDPNSEGYYGAPDTFVQQVINAFAINHAQVDDQTARYFADQLWRSDPRVQAYYQLNPTDTANAGMIGGYLFSPKSTLPSLAYQAMQQLDPSNLTTSQADFVNAGGNPTATTAGILQQAGALGTGSNEIMSIIADEAQKAAQRRGLNDQQTKELVATAIATADAESGLNPNAVGDQGHSVGLFQLHDQGMGYGMGNSRYDPRTNAAKALDSMAATFAANPGLSPGQLAAMSQRPADPAGYAGIVNNIFGKIMGGQLPSVGQPSKTFGPEYTQAENIYAKYFGKTADPGVIESIMGAGNDVQQMEDYVRSLGSHIPGLTIGQYTDQRGLMDSAAKQLLGHQVTDNMVAEAWNQNLTSPDQLKLWLNNLRGPVDAKTYNAIVTASRPILSGVWNETGFDPRWANQIAGDNGGVTNTQAAAAADNAPVAALQAADQVSAGGSGSFAD